MTITEMLKYLSDKAAATEFVILRNASPPNQDMAVFLLGTTDERMGTAITLSGLEILQSRDPRILLGCRFDQACATLREAKKPKGEAA